MLSIASRHGDTAGRVGKSGLVYGPLAPRKVDIVPDHHLDQFGEATRTLAQAIARSTAYSIAGGGDTLAAIEKYRVEDVSYISTGGGAFLEFLEGKELPGIKVLED